jgi:hypothetical protein
MDKQPPRTASISVCIAMCFFLGVGGLGCIAVNLYQFKHGQLAEPLSWIVVAVALFTGFVLLHVAARFAKSAWLQWTDPASSVLVK